MHGSNIFVYFSDKYVEIKGILLQNIERFLEGDVVLQNIFPESEYY